MKLIDDLVEAFAEHERVSVEYASALQEIDCLSDEAAIKDQDIALIQAASEKMAGIANDVISARDQEIRQLKIDLEETHKLWGETTVELAAAEKLVDQVRIVLFDVVGMYNKLEAANDGEGKD